VHITVAGDRLLLEAAAVPPTTILDALKQHKAEIIRLLTIVEPAVPASHTNGAGHNSEDWEEHAAVMEYDGDIPRSWAEAQARLTSRPPPDVPQRQWDQMRNDFGGFLDRWAHDVDTLGWRPVDLLGWDPARLYTPVAKHVGLIWKLDGAAVLEMTRSVIRTTRGTYWKCQPHEWSAGRAQSDGLHEPRPP
jgi:hypothetical protein